MSDYDSDSSGSPRSQTSESRTELADFNFMSIIGYTSANICGYCKKRNESFSYYSQTTSISAEFYQVIADKSWRRSGALLYRPDPRLSCCRHYTIRLDSLQYKPTRNQRQAMNAFNRYILGKDYIKAVAQLYPRTRAETKWRDNHFDFPARIHEAEYCNVKRLPEPAHRFELTIEEDVFTEEKFLLYAAYQERVHRPPKGSTTRNAFTRFLCNSPIRRGKFEAPDGTERDVGSFHHCYRIDGKLVALAVLDLLPSCVSSVYFFYDENLVGFSPGKLSAMMEIALARERGYQWWYAGYYIHSCPKMHYKMDFQPQYVLDIAKGEYLKVDKIVYDILQRPYRDLIDTHRRVLAGDEKALLDPPDAISRDTRIQNIFTAQLPTDKAEVVSLFEVDMPGILSADEIEKQDLDGIPLHLRSVRRTFVMTDLPGWMTDGIRQFPEIKSQVAELVAALGGMEVVKEQRVCVQHMQ